MSHVQRIRWANTNCKSVKTVREIRVLGSTHSFPFTFFTFFFVFSFTQFGLNVNCWFGFFEIIWYSCSTQHHHTRTQFIFTVNGMRTSLSLLFFIRLRVEQEQHHQRHSHHHRRCCCCCCCQALRLTRAQCLTTEEHLLVMYGWRICFICKNVRVQHSQAPHLYMVFRSYVIYFPQLN